MQRIGWPILIAAAVAAGIGIGMLLDISRTAFNFNEKFSFAVLAGMFIIVLILWRVPQFQVLNVTDDSAKRFELENQARTTLVQIIGGTVILLGLYTAWQNSQLTAIAREGAITDRFTHALDELGSDHVQPRLGAIYALERVARESPASHWSVMEALTAYIRAEDYLSKQVEVQAVITVIGRRCGYHPPMPLLVVQNCSNSFQESPDQVIDLKSTDLREIRFNTFHLELARLTDARLQRAHFVSTYLEGADLKNARLNDAHLEGADLKRALLNGADLEGADLLGADLRDTDFRGADLRGAKHLTQDQINAAIVDASTKLPAPLTAPQSGSHMSK